MAKVTSASNGTMGTGQDDDICPVCKSSRYLNPTMRFLVNPECYHKMCESCVDRIFSQGPAPCPVAGCGRTLRKQRFRRATFEDLQIEREVDIRRRVAAVFNRREDEFMDLRSWNDYLEQVETTTFNLLYKIDVEETEEKLAAYAAKNKDTIKRNAALENAENGNFEAQMQAQKQASRIKREESLREEAEEKKQRHTDIIKAQDRIAATGDPAAALKRKKPGQGTTAMKGGAKKTAATDAGEAFEFRGLRPVGPVVAEDPYDPFGSYAIEPRFPQSDETYVYPWLDKAKSDPAIVTGGYDANGYCARAMIEAFSGLGVFVEA